jgi:hypothetical protein
MHLKHALKLTVAAVLLALLLMYVQICWADVGTGEEVKFTAAATAAAAAATAATAAASLAPLYKGCAMGVGQMKTGTTGG